MGLLLPFALMGWTFPAVAVLIMPAVQFAHKLQLTLDKSTAKPDLMIAAIWHFANHGGFD